MPENHTMLRTSLQHMKRRIQDIKEEVASIEEDIEYALALEDIRHIRRANEAHQSGTTVPLD
jgi:septation ring formation regulator EzrA